jgi:mannan endo-1,4-beta-mannosidase
MMDRRRFLGTPAAAGVALLLLLVAGAPAAQVGVPIEAESGQLVGGATVATVRAGYSGAGYVTSLSQPGDSLRLPITGTGAFVQIRLAVASAIRPNSFEVRLDGQVIAAGSRILSGAFNEIVVDERRLAAGPHTLTIRGTFDVDYVRLTPASYPPPAPAQPVLSDPDATPATRALFAFLLDTYGTHILSGQQDVYQNGAPRTAEIAYVAQQTGRVPAIGAFDLINYSPSRRQFGANPTGWAEHWAQWAGTDGIVTLMWHWNAPAGLLNTSAQPWWRGFYTEATTFDIEAVLANPAGPEYALLLRDIDAIAVELRKFADADVPVLWRPIHEAYGGWFWWGARGPAPYVALWRLLHQRLTVHHGLHNLIWVHTHRPTDADQAAWYPGDDVVDVVGLDIYSSDPASVFQDQWALAQAQFGGNKLVTLSETGTLPDLTRSQDFGVLWSWFAIWEGGFLRDVPAAHLSAVYNSEVVLTRDELPDWRAYVLSRPDGPGAADAAPLVLSPNPSAGPATARLDLPAPADVRVEVFTLTGRLVARADLGPRPAGPLATPVPAVHAAGTYVVRVTAGGAVARGLFVVAR